MSEPATPKGHRSGSAAPFSSPENNLSSLIPEGIEDIDVKLVSNMAVLSPGYESRLRRNEPRGSKSVPSKRMRPRVVRSLEHQFGSFSAATPISSLGKVPSLSLTSQREQRHSAPTTYSDRYIPSRSGSNLINALDVMPMTDRLPSGDGDIWNSPRLRSDSGHSAYSMLLRNELLGTNNSPKQSLASPPKLQSVSSSNSARKPPHSAGGIDSGHTSPRSTDGTPLFCERTLRFRSPAKSAPKGADPYSLSPAQFTSTTKGLLIPNPKHRRKISKTPFKILDAPQLRDDFYLNLVDWSSQNILAVALGARVYLWSPCTGNVSKLCDLGAEDDVTSVSWSLRGDILAVGTRTGGVQLWDTGKMQFIRLLDGHFARVGALSWSSQLLASGSRDRFIFLRDRRSPQSRCAVLARHSQEVCGLKWSPDEANLASGGNDNKLLIWNVRASDPTVHFEGEHNAAVKAIAWSPHQHGLIASGGGTADRCIRFWNTLSGTALHSVDTGSQVCNLMWSTSVDEIVSTHGYSLNQIVVWNYATMQPLVTLTGHTFRVIYLAMSPDGQTIVTGAGDETLRFWNVFPSSKPKGTSRTDSLFLSFPSNIR
eukprot:gb/GEZN01002956.1/.p1 GENE.gb/GEZN01002956.1/~~gb/GEZN01002956.1/.p1  ORF type:complete len:596 (-),score=32.86 gb/GEZN01002956.1/:363-2150(-)